MQAHCALHRMIDGPLTIDDTYEMIGVAPDRVPDWNSGGCGSVSGCRAAVCPSS